jgi:hypothetical protein
MRPELYLPPQNTENYSSYASLHSEKNSRLAYIRLFQYWLDDRGFESRQELGIFLFTATFRPALGPT